MKLQKPTFSLWRKSGSPWVWINSAAVAICIIAVLGLLAVLAVNGLSHFWPKDIMQAEYQLPGADKKIPVIGEVADAYKVPGSQLQAAGVKVPDAKKQYQRLLIKMGNRDLTGADFGWFLQAGLSNVRYPEELVVMQRREWGNFYGRILAIENTELNAQQTMAQHSNKTLFKLLQKRIQRVLAIHSSIEAIEKQDIGDINHKMEQLRLQTRRLALDNVTGDALRNAQQTINQEKAELDKRYQHVQKELNALYQKARRDVVVVEAASGQSKRINLEQVVTAIQPNAMNIFEKTQVFFQQIKAFIVEDPREANTEGGIFPAIFGTVLMVVLMAIMVTPLGVIAAVYLREYASQGLVTQTIRVAVNNLAGVPSIVYGVFGLGFFIYFVGGGIDQWLFKESLPSPTFGTPGLLWASLTLALLTLPVVIVATEEGLARVPRSVKEGSLALGATKFETITKVVLPMASPAMMTGLILAIARAAGEVAPLMLVGVVKLAPSLPLNSHYPYLHLDQKFMHLGFHIYDVGFQSPNVEAARPLVYATALLLVVVIALLNFAAVALRNRLREKYQSLEH